MYPSTALRNNINLLFPEKLNLYLIISGIVNKSVAADLKKTI